MTPFCFRATATGDVDTAFKFTTDLKSWAVQRLRQNFQFFLGEWFLDQRQGLPYFKFILGQRFDAAICDRLFRKAALQTVPGCSVTTLRLSFDRRTRTLSVPLLLLTMPDGSAITQDDLGAPFIVSLDTGTSNTTSNTELGS